MFRKQRRRSEAKGVKSRVVKPDRTDLFAFILAAYSLVLPVVAAIFAAMLLFSVLFRLLVG